ALIACNALGDVVDPDTGQVIAGARTEDGRALLDTRRALLRGDVPTTLLAGATSPASDPKETTSMSTSTPTAEASRSSHGDISANRLWPTISSRSASATKAISIWAANSRRVLSVLMI